jgi:hypothetical protein
MKLLNFVFWCTAECKFSIYTTIHAKELEKSHNSIHFNSVLYYLHAEPTATIIVVVVVVVVVVAVTTTTTTQIIQVLDVIRRLC